MGDNEKLEKWLSEHDCEDFCQYCDYGCDSPSVVPDGNGNPIFPPFADWDDNDVLEHFDTDSILQDIVEEERNE